jgi:hypothetical protein
MAKTRLNKSKKYTGWEEMGQKKGMNRGPYEGQFVK